MKVISSPSFVRAARRIIKKNPRFAEELKRVLEQLETDLFHPQLKTHKLKGSLIGSRACSVAYDLRIVFDIERLENEEVILLIDIGTHDEVY